MIAQAPGGADHDMRAALEHAALLLWVHPADADRGARAGLLIEPVQLAPDLHGQFARRRDDQRQRAAADRDGAVVGQQFGRHRHAEGHGLARSGLRRNHQIARPCVVLEHRRLDGSGVRIAASGQGLAENRRYAREGQGNLGHGALYTGFTPGCAEHRCSRVGGVERAKGIEPSS